MPYIYFFWGRTKMIDQVSDVSSDWVHSLSLFCPQLSSLTISRWMVSGSLHSNVSTLNVQLKLVQHTKSEIKTPLTTVQVRTWRWVGCLHCHSSQSPQYSTFTGCNQHEPRVNLCELFHPSHQTFLLFKVSSISHFGFAELLRSLPELRSLGRCDCFGEVRKE